MKIIEVSWEGRSYDTARWIEELKEIRVTIGDGPFFECPTDSGAIYAATLPSHEETAKGLGWEPEDSDVMEEWTKPENWTKHETFIDFLFSTIEELSPLG